MFHIDVADGHYVDTLLFFPDLVKACRAHTKKPFEVHLIVTHPLKWVDAFADAVEGKHPFPVPESEVLATLAAFEAALSSMATGRPIVCDG